MNQVDNKTEKKIEENGSIGDTLVIKDYDGTLKIMADGELKELDHFLEQSEVSQSNGELSVSSGKQLGMPKFTDIAVIPNDDNFSEPVISKDSGGMSDLQFHTDDQSEVQKELDKLSATFDLVPQKQYSIDKIASKIATKHALKLSEQDISVFKKIILSYFRQMRSRAETRAVLVGDRSEGGLLLKPESVDHLLLVAQHLKEKIESIDGIVIEEGQLKNSKKSPAVTGSEKEESSLSTQAEKSGLPEPVDQPSPKEEPSPSPVQDTKSSPEANESKDSSESVRRLGGMGESMVKSSEVEPVSQEPVDKDKKSEPEFRPHMPKEDQPKAPRPTRQSAIQAGGDQPRAGKPPIESIVDKESKLPKVSRQQPSESAMNMIQDVRYPVKKKAGPKLTGRVDELAGMDIQTWRMLDENPRIRAGKILGKIQNLQQESYTRKSQGIDAWRNSEVYKLYLQLGQKSLEQGKNVAEVIGELKGQSQTTLELNEFEAISDLNRSIRF